MAPEPEKLGIGPVWLRLPQAKIDGPPCATHVRLDLEIANAAANVIDIVLAGRLRMHEGSAVLAEFSLLALGVRCTIAYVDPINCAVPVVHLRWRTVDPNRV